MISTPTARMLALMPAHPSSLYIKLHPWSTVDPLKDIQRTAQSFPITHPREVSAVCHWAGGRQSVLCGTFSVSLLSEVPLGLWQCPLPMQLTLPYKAECSLQEQWEKVSFSIELMSILSAHSSQGMDACPQWPTYYSVWFLLPPVPSLSPSPCIHQL